jgi:hypothetical protein
MGDNLKAVIENLDDTVQRARDKATSRQPRFTDAMSFFSSVYRWALDTSLNLPDLSIDNRRRDTALRAFWPKEPHLAGVLNTVVSIDKNRGWTLTGGRNQVRRYEEILRRAENGMGWRHFIAGAATAYYTSDLGSVTEVATDGDPGPLIDLYNVDPTACYLTGKPDKPLAYIPGTWGRVQEWPARAFFRCVSMPSTDQNMGGMGYCAISRAAELAKLMLAVYQHDQEKLGQRAPRGLLLLNNITQQQWMDAMTVRDANLTEKELDYYGMVEVLAQMGSDPPDAKLIALSSLPDNFNIETTTNLLMYAYALSFGYDPIEFWPVASGALGRGRETEIQHRKATGKGGAEFILSFQDNLQRELPETLLFEFEQRDAEGELLDASIAQSWANVVHTLYQNGSGVLTQQQAISFLAQKGMIPSDWTEVEESASVDATGVERGGALSSSKGKLRYLREGAMQFDRVRRAIAEYPKQPIVKWYSSGKEVVLWESGAEAMRRSVWVAPDVGEVTRRPSRQAHSSTGRTNQRETLYSEDDVTITDKDVSRAVGAFNQRADGKYSGMLEAVA